MLDFSGDVVKIKRRRCRGDEKPLKFLRAVIVRIVLVRFGDELLHFRLLDWPLTGLQMGSHDEIAKTHHRPRPDARYP